MIYQITAPHFCSGLETTSGIVMTSAPIIRYMQGLHIESVKNYCIRRGWKIEEVKENGQSDPSVPKV